MSAATLIAFFVPSTATTMESFVHAAYRLSTPAVSMYIYRHTYVFKLRKSSTYIVVVG
jgi:aspartate carbamoyltransferase catalytic subunit